jgi:hypothetical protein
VHNFTDEAETDGEFGCVTGAAIKASAQILYCGENVVRGGGEEGE